MPSTSTGIFYPSEGSSNLDGDIQQMMTDIDTKMAALAARAARLRVVYGTRAIMATLSSATAETNHTISSVDWNTGGCYSAGSPDRLTLSQGIWLVQGYCSMSAAAGTLNFGAVSVTLGSTSVRVAGQQTGPLGVGYCDLTCSALIFINTTDYIQLFRAYSSTSVTTLTSNGVMVAHRLRS